MVKGNLKVLSEFKKYMRLADCGIESIWPVFKTRMLGPVHTATFSYENGVNFSVFALRSHCSAVKTGLFENANENA